MAINETIEATVRKAEAISEELNGLSVTQLQERLEASQLKLQLHAQESVIDFVDNYSDFRDEIIDPVTGEFWLGLGSERGQGSPNNLGLFDLTLNTEFDLSIVRAIGRALALRNEFAQNVLENRINFTVGTGIVYSATAKPGQKLKVSEELLNEVQEFIDDFIEQQDWDVIEQELVGRRDRDGEFFLRFFPQFDGSLEVRVIEPEEVYTPDDEKGSKTCSFGIECDPEDRKKVLGYWVNGELVDASEMMHIKANVDHNVKRGLSSLYSVNKNFRRAEKLQRNMATVAAIQAALAAVRTFDAPESAINRFLQKKVVATGPETKGFARHSGKQRNIEQWREGTILNMGKGQKMEFFTKAIDASRFVMVLQSELRAIAARFVMPEFMLSSDASNGSYASTMIAETPAVRAFQKLQSIFKKVGKKTITRALKHAASVGLLPTNILDIIKVQAEAPSLVVRDVLKDAKANQVKSQEGVLSVQTWASQDGLDYQQEQTNIEEHLARHGGFDAAANPLTLPPEEDDAPEL